MSFEIIDISKDLLTAELYPGDPKPEVSIFSAIARGDECNMAKISSTLHCGTHADAPLHFINGGDSIGTAVLDSFIGECAVIDVPPGRITGQYADEHFPKGVKGFCSARAVRLILTRPARRKQPISATS